MTGLDKRLRWRTVQCAAVALGLLTTHGASAQTEIHRCVQADGTVSFQETPCPEPVETQNDPADDPEPANQPGARDDVFESPFDHPGEELVIVEPDVPVPSRDRAECEKLTRDAIDAIELKMQAGYSAEQGEQYKAELLTLTRQLRACKAL